MTEKFTCQAELVEAISIEAFLLYKNLSLIKDEQMGLQVESIIESTEALNNTYFESTKIVIVEYNNKGAVGFIINKRFARNLNELEEFKHLPVIPLFEGGPIDQEHLYFIHTRPDLIEDGTPIGRGIYFGGNLKQATSSLQSKAITIQQIKIFIGYCGWDANELEEELKEGSWIITTNNNPFQD